MARPSMSLTKDLPENCKSQNYIKYYQKVAEQQYKLNLKYIWLILYIKTKMTVEVLKK